MGDKVSSRYKLIIFIPLILGILIYNIGFISKLYADMFRAISILFIIFWFWAGRIFARLSENKRKGFYLGNKLWLISFVIFRLWLNLPQRRNIFSIFLEGFAQYYVIGITPIVVNVLEIINIPFLVSTGMGRVTVAYVVMFIVFSVGFCCELYWKKNKKKLIIITAFLAIISLPIINLLDPVQTHAFKDTGTFVKENSQEIKINYSDYSRRGFSVYLDFRIKDGKIDWKITNPKGEIIFKGYEVIENGKLYREITYPRNYEGYFMIKPPNMLGKYILTIKASEAVGEYDVYWEDTPAPLM